jgi:hypothetical protein
MTTNRLTQDLWRVAFAMLLSAATSPAWPDDSKDQALARLAACHDPEIPIAIGRVVVKQAGLRRMRVKLSRAGAAAALGRDWNASAVHWQAAEKQMAHTVDNLITDRLLDQAWFRQGWARAAGGVLTGEEAGEIATHFETEGGREQRVVVEMVLIGETVLANYTFTERIDYQLKGSEAEIRDLQRSWWAREPLRERDFSRYPNVVRFAGENPGIKYSRMLAIQGVGMIVERIDRVTAEALEAVDAADVGPFVEAHRRDAAKSR